MGRRYFYAIVDETHRRELEKDQMQVGSWNGYQHNAWYQEQRRLRGQAPMK